LLLILIFTRKFIVQIIYKLSLVKIIFIHNQFYVINFIKINYLVCTTEHTLKLYFKFSAGGIFRNYEGECIGCFSQFLGNKDALHAELVAAMIAIEIAYHKGFRNIWLESDSQLVNLASKSNLVVPWCLKNRWQNCLFRLRSMRLIVSHIYREENTCADSLANLVLSFPS